MDKVKLPKSAAEAIENMRAKGAPLNEIVERHVCKDHIRVNGWELVHHLSTDTLIRALYIGYEVEQTPEDKVREYYKELRKEHEQWSSSNTSINSPYGYELTGCVRTLSLLNIKIKGVNDNG